MNTHHADSYLMAKLPADGTYYVHLGDTARNGGEEYAYRLRISPPQPDFALRVVPSSIGLRSKATAPVTVHAIRKDGFAGPIKLSLKDPPAGFSSAPVTLPGTQAAGAADAENRPGRHEGAGQPTRRRPREDSGPGGRPRGRAGGRPDAGLPVAASRSRRGAAGRGLRPLLRAAAQTRPPPAAAVGRRGQARGRARRTRQGSRSSPSSRLPDVCGSSSSSLKKGFSPTISTISGSRNAKPCDEHRSGDCPNFHGHRQLVRSPEHPQYIPQPALDVLAGGRFLAVALDRGDVPGKRRGRHGHGVAETPPLPPSPESTGRPGSRGHSVAPARRPQRLAGGCSCR